MNARWTTKQRAIDTPFKRFVTECYNRAHKILEDKIEILHKMAHALLERETLDRDEIQMLLRGEELPPLKRKHAAPKPEPAPVSADEKASEARTQFPGKPQPLPRPNTP